MRVRVVHAFDCHLVHVCAEELPGQILRALGREAVVVVDLAAVDALEHEHALGDVRPDHLRHDDVTPLLEHARDELRVVRLLGQVELGAKVHLELVRERTSLEELGALGTPLERLRRRAEQCEVDLDLLLDPRPAHLDDHLASRLQQGRVDLRDRRRGDGLGVDPRERVRRKILADRPLDLREGYGRDLVDELPELLDVYVGKQVGT